MKKWGVIFIGAVFVAGLLAASAEAQLIVDPSKKAQTGQFECGDVFSSSKIEYEGSASAFGLSIEALGDVERTLLGGYGAYGLNDRIDLYAGLGYIVKAAGKAEISGGNIWDEEGDGFLVTAGGRAFIMEKNGLTILAYGQLQRISEDYGEMNIFGSTVEAEGTFTELNLGAVARHNRDKLSLYGGLELTPYSDGEVEVSAAGLSLDADAERDSMFGIRLGASYGLDGWWLRGELALLSEEALTIGAGISF